MINNLSVDRGSPLRSLLTVIDNNGLGAAFVVDKAGKLVGVVTDGDIRRALLRGMDLVAPVSEIMTTDFISLPVASDVATKFHHLTGKIRIIPLVDEDFRPVDYATAYRHQGIPVAEPSMTEIELANVTECITTGWVSSQGRFCTDFEAAFGEYVGCEHGVLVSSGTAALHISMLALGLGPGDEVIVPDLTFAASAATVVHTGATPVLVDVEPGSWCIDPKSIETALSPRTKAVMPVHLYGMPADMDAINNIAEAHGLYVIEDAAEALGSSHGGRRSGTIGDAAAFSFFGNKLITTGEGGMILFKRAEHADKARLLRDHGMDPAHRYWHLEAGFNYRMTNLQAAVGLAQLERIDDFIEKKNRIDAQYRALLGDIPSVTFQEIYEDRTNVCWTFSLLIDFPEIGLARADLMNRLTANGVESRPLFYPLHTMPPFKDYPRSDRLDTSISLSARGISLPSSISLTPAQIEYVANSLKRILSVRSLAAPN